MPTVPVDPLLYRFYEIMQVYGLPLKDSSRNCLATES